MLQPKLVARKTQVACCVFDNCIKHVFVKRFTAWFLARHMAGDKKMGRSVIGQDSGVTRDIRRSGTAELELALEEG